MSMRVENSTTYLNDQDDHLKPPPPAREYSSGGCWGKKSNLEKKLIVLSSCLAALAIAFVVALAVVASQKKADDTVTQANLLTQPTQVSLITHGTQPTQVSLVTHGPTTSLPPSSTVDPRLCNEEHCKASANYFLRNMNLRADPCDDFHEYVCGKWVENTPIPEDRGRYGVFDDLRSNLSIICIAELEKPEGTGTPNSAIEKAKSFFGSCVKTETVDESTGMTQLKALLSDVNISPEITPDGFPLYSDFNVYKTLSMIVRNYGLNFILSFGIGSDVKNTTNNMISLNQPSSLGIGRSFLVDFNKTSDRILAYKTYITSSLCLFNPSLCSNMETVADEIIEFEVNMTKLTRSPVDRRNASSWYFPKTLAELTDSVPEIPFFDYVTDILNKTDNNVVNDTIVIVREEEYFRNVYPLLSNTRVVSNYLGWRLVQSLGPSLFKKLRTIKFEFDKINLGIKEEKRIEERCFDLANSYYGHAVGKLYIDAIQFSDALKRDVEEMVHYLGAAFEELVDVNDWMDQPTKTASKAKLNKMVNMIGYPDWTRDANKLNDFYNGKPMDKDNFLNSYRDSMEFSTKKSFEKLGKTNNRAEDWNSVASIVNAFYGPTANSITFPAGILQIPFYGDRLKVLNYGAIGYVIGHEITHGFDDSGRQYDGDGSLNNWWSDETLQGYIERRNCFVDQYSSITDTQTGKNLNGAQTIGENIADNGGIRESYKAYLLSNRTEVILPGLEQFDDLQLFYISAASVWCSQFTNEEMENQISQGVHSPGMYRAYVPLANDEGFANAFNCPLGSKMNPAKRCTIW